MLTRFSTRTRTSSASVALCLSLYFVVGCARDASGRIEDPAPPGFLLGEFEDDYGNRFTISEEIWLQHPSTRYLVHRWTPDDRYLIAQNHSDNPSDPGLWTRIDWIELTEMVPYEWAFCLSEYRAPSAEAAEGVSLADPMLPRAGCNGFPYSRMKRIEAEPSRHPTL